jgi:hypothetical protein
VGQLDERNADVLAEALQAETADDGAGSASNILVDGPARLARAS